MSTRYTAEYWDHERDIRKADWRPGDAPSIDQRAAVSKLVGYCEGICSSGSLTPMAESMLRKSIAETLVAFNMPSRVESEHA